MSKLSYKVSIPIILAAGFAIVAFIALNYEKLELSFYVLLLFVTIYVFSFGFATGQRFASPVKKLLERAKELSKGDLSSRAYLETKDEIAELAKVFNEIADALEESHTKQESTEKSVDIKVKAKTQALEETINALEQKVQNRTIELQRLVGDLDKFKEESQKKEVEITALRQQMESAKASPRRISTERRAPKKKKPRIKKNSAGLEKIVGNLEKLQKQTKERSEETEELIEEIKKIKEEALGKDHI